MHILSKHRELSNQINIHEIAENFRRNLASIPFFKIKKKKKKKNKKKKGRENERQSVQACRVRANLTSRKEVYLYQDKNSHPTCFFCRPYEIPAEISQDNKRNYIEIEK
jgi:hypothetical protein